MLKFVFEFRFPSLLCFRYQSIDPLPMVSFLIEIMCEVEVLKETDLFSPVETQNQITLLNL